MAVMVCCEVCSHGLSICQDNEMISCHILELIGLHFIDSAWLR